MTNKNQTSMPSGPSNIAQHEMQDSLDKIQSDDYAYGFVTDLEQDTLPPGLDESVIRQISKIKNEPDWLLDFRLKAYRVWLKMPMPDWQHLKIEPIDYQALSYYSAPKSQADGPKSLDEVDPELLRVYAKLGIPLAEQEILAGVAVDAVFDSVSVATSYTGKVLEKGIIFCSFSSLILRFVVLKLIFNFSLICRAVIFLSCFISENTVSFTVSFCDFTVSLSGSVK